MKYPDTVDYKSFLVERSTPTNETNFQKLLREIQIATIQHFITNLEIFEIPHNQNELNKSNPSLEYKRQGLELKSKLIANKLTELLNELESKSNISEEDLKKFEAPEPIKYILEIEHTNSLDEKTDTPTFTGTLEDCIEVRDKYLVEQSGKHNLALRESRSQGTGIVRIAESETLTIETFINKVSIPTKLRTKRSMWDPKVEEPKVEVSPVIRTLK